MSKSGRGTRGVLLIMVLGAILVVTILANIALNIISSQAKLTHHQVARTQGYYAALAGVNYAIEKLRLGDDANWLLPAPFTHNLCRSGCSAAGDINDEDMPASLIRVEITVGNVINAGPQSGTRPISAKAIYTSPVS